MLQSKLEKLQSDLFTLGHVVKITIPSTVDVNTGANDVLINKVKTLVVEKLASWFGGCTVSDGQGAWVSDNVGLVYEDVQIAASYCTSDALESHLDNVVDLALHVKRTMAQEAVALEIDGILYLV